jgi:hypothetical protein
MTKGKKKLRAHDVADRKGKNCSICGGKANAGSTSLCSHCYSGFEEMMKAVGALHYEMATAYGIDPNDIEECSKRLPGIAVEEIAIRMELNRLKVDNA